MQEFMELLDLFSITILKISVFRQLGVDLDFCLILGKVKHYFNIFHSNICSLLDLNVVVVLVMSLSAMVFATKHVQQALIQLLKKPASHVVKATIGMDQAVLSFVLQVKISIHTTTNVNVLQELTGQEQFALIAPLGEFITL